MLQRKKKEPWPTLPLQIGLYERKNMKVTDIEDKEIEKFTFCCLDYNLYDPMNICKQNCAKIHCSWPSETYSRPKKERIKNCYNASKFHEPVSSASTS